MYDEYHKSEEDVQAMIRYLEIHDPKNANRDYAIQFIDSMEGFGSELARSDESLAEAIKRKYCSPRCATRERVAAYRSKLAVEIDKSTLL